MLKRIKIPSTVKLMEVELCEGLEQIEKAFSNCSLLERVSIPSTVKFIHYSAFEKCPRLETVVFCEEIKLFVSTVCAASREWWNHGISPEALVLHCF